MTPQTSLLDTQYYHKIFREKTKPRAQDIVLIIDSGLCDELLTEPSLQKAFCLGKGKPEQATLKQISGLIPLVCSASTSCAMSNFKY